MQKIKLYADYEPGNPPDDFPQIKLYNDADKKEEREAPILVGKDGALVSFERVTDPTAPFVFDGLSVNSASTEIPGLDWYVEQNAAYLKDLGNTGGGITTYLYTLSILGGDGKRVYFDPQLVNTGGSGGG